MGSILENANSARQDIWKICFFFYIFVISYILWQNCESGIPNYISEEQSLIILTPFLRMTTADFDNAIILITIFFATFLNVFMVRLPYISLIFRLLKNLKISIYTFFELWSFIETTLSLALVLEFGILCHLKFELFAHPELS